MAPRLPKPTRHSTGQGTPKGWKGRRFRYRSPGRRNSHRLEIILLGDTAIPCTDAWPPITQEPEKPTIYLAFHHIPMAKASMVGTKFKHFSDGDGGGGRLTSDLGIENRRGCPGERRTETRHCCGCGCPRPPPPLQSKRGWRQRGTDGESSSARLTPSSMLE